MTTVCSLYDETTNAQNAVQDLVNHGFRRDDISIVVHDAQGMGAESVYAQYHGEYIPDDEEVEHIGAGTLLGGVGGFVLGLAAIVIPGIGPALAAGPIASAILGAGTGAVTGGLVGAMIDRGLNKDMAGYYAEGIRRGGTFVTVQVDDDRVGRAKAILDRHYPVDIEARADQWRAAGWDPDAGSHI